MRFFEPKNYLKLTAVVLLIISFALLFWTRFSMRLAMLEQSPAGTIFARWLGASMIGHVYLNWRNGSYGATTIKQVLLMNLIVLATAAIFDVYNLLQFGLHLNWLLILFMHAIFLVGFVISLLINARQK